MSRVLVRVKHGNWTYEEDVTDDILEHFTECQSNGANPGFELITFEHYTRPLALFDAGRIGEIEDHFIFGWFEGWAQSQAQAICGDGPVMLEVLKN